MEEDDNENKEDQVRHIKELSDGTVTIELKNLDKSLDNENLIKIIMQNCGDLAVKANVLGAQGKILLGVQASKFTDGLDTVWGLRLYYKSMVDLDTLETATGKLKEMIDEEKSKLIAQGEKIKFDA